jgi:cytochrome c biogenesis factor
MLIAYFSGTQRRRQPFSLVTSRQLFYLSSVLNFFALIFLLGAFLNNDFRYAYVYQNSSTDLSLIYKIAAVWAGKEGSFLLWLFILNIVGIVASRTENTYENILLSVVILRRYSFCFCWWWNLHFAISGMHTRSIFRDAIFYQRGLTVWG